MLKRSDPTEEPEPPFSEWGEGDDLDNGGCLAMMLIGAGGVVLLVAIAVLCAPWGG